MPNKNKKTKPSKPAAKAPSKPAKAVKHAEPAPKKGAAKPAAKHGAPAKAAHAPAKAAHGPAKKAAANVPAKKHAAPPAPAKKLVAAAPHAKAGKHPAPAAKPAHHAPAAKKGAEKSHKTEAKHEKHAAPVAKHAAPVASNPAAPKDGGKRRFVGGQGPAPKDAQKEGKKGAHLKVVPTPEPEVAAPAAKKKAELVVEVPAPKGVALLRGTKGKKGKAESSAAALGKKRCREPGCDHEFMLSGYCRLHYIKNWRKIKRKEAILASGQLNNYVEELVNKYPDKYLDVIRQDLASEKEWSKVVVDLELETSDDESGDDSDDAAAEGVRTGGRGDFDDDSDSF